MQRQGCNAAAALAPWIIPAFGHRCFGSEAKFEAVKPLPAHSTLEVQSSHSAVHIQTKMAEYTAIIKVPTAPNGFANGRANTRAITHAGDQIGLEYQSISACARRQQHHRLGVLQQPCMHTMRYSLAVRILTASVPILSADRGADDGQHLWAHDEHHRRRQEDRH